MVSSKQSAGGQFFPEAVAKHYLDAICLRQMPQRLGGAGWCSGRVGFQSPVYSRQADEEGSDQTIAPCRLCNSPVFSTRIADYSDLRPSRDQLNQTRGFTNLPIVLNF